MKRKGLLIALLLSLSVCVGVLFTSCGSGSDEPSGDAKAYTLVVVDDNGESTEYTADTEAEFLAGALDELTEQTDFTYEADDSGFITTVNGLKADYNADGAYWAIYVNDEFGQYGASEQPVTDGDTYKLEYTKG
jgi:ABC-type phosphate/phosphonate transport system substrate-binding protein